MDNDWKKCDPLDERESSSLGKKDKTIRLILSFLLHSIHTISHDLAEVAQSYSISMMVHK